MTQVSYSYAPPGPASQSACQSAMAGGRLPTALVSGSAGWHAAGNQRGLLDRGEQRDHSERVMIRGDVSMNMGA
jgi:hypothetical protein